jgi:hypothetical protein
VGGRHAGVEPIGAALLMGYELRRQIRDLLPEGFLTLAERNVLLELADCANDKTRLAYPGMEELVRMTDLPQTTVSKCLQRLAGKGIELRVAVGVDKNGRPVFAARGHQTTYRIPDLTKGGPGSYLSGAERADGGPANPEGKGGPGSGKGQTPIRERADPRPRKGGPGSAPSPQEPSRNTSKNQKTAAPASPSSSSARTRERSEDEGAHKPATRRLSKTDRARIAVVERLGVDTAEASELIAYLVGNARDNGAPIHNIAAFIDACPDEDLNAHLDEIRDLAVPDEHDEEGERIREHIAAKLPYIPADDAAAVAAAYAARRREGTDSALLIAALNRVVTNDEPTGPKFLAAIRKAHLAAA